MSDVRKSVECDYCGVSFHLKYSKDEHPQFCCFCGESFDDPEEVEDDEEDFDEEEDENEDEEYN